MYINILGSAAGLPSKTRKTQSIILDMVNEINEYFLIDVGEALQHQLLKTSIKPSKINHVFITHLHGDHIYGLPGFLSSRAHQGGEGKPLTIYGPKGLKEWLDVTFSVSETTLNYPIDFIEITDGDQFKIKNVDITVKRLNHNIDSFLYMFKEENQKGALNVEKLKAEGIQPGPIYSEIKESETFMHNNNIYYTKDFLGPEIKGRKIAIHGDTRPVEDINYLNLISHSDCVIHEATFLDYEYEKANDYYHSEIHKVLDIQKDLNVKQYIFTHISNRYEEEFLKHFINKLPKGVLIAHDFLKVEIPRKI
ncbi:ribonuclease Z [Nosocomiicoccus ampullae]|uniref:ribonuclease Z n=1 Tax=Nosocomiicoccus ampullae TaxID=489910 RepID=UPI001C5F45DA|nr:ribonuclease Z [Nosocomiicoccus ampullae]QYA49252.1 ribonuclease Z [Nosocomiicoccus ampullae]